MAIHEFAIFLKFPGLGNTGIPHSKMKNILLHFILFATRKTSTMFDGPLDFGGTYCNAELFDPFIG